MKRSFSIVGAAGLCAALACTSVKSGELPGEFSLRFTFDRPATSTQARQLQLSVWRRAASAPTCATLLQTGFPRGQAPDQSLSYDWPLSGAAEGPALRVGATPVLLAVAVDDTQRVVARGCLSVAAPLRPGDQRNLEVALATEPGIDPDDGGTNMPPDGGGDPPDPASCVPENGCGQGEICPPINPNFMLTDRACTPPPPAQELVSYPRGAVPTSPLLDCFAEPETFQTGFPAQFRIRGNIRSLQPGRSTAGLTVTWFARRPRGGVGSRIAEAIADNDGDYAFVVDSSDMPPDGLVTTRVTGPGFVDLWTFDVFFDPKSFAPPEAIECEDICTNLEDEVAVSHATYARIARQLAPDNGVAGADDLGDGAGQGILLGEVLDCDETLLEGAVIGFEPSDLSPVFFDLFDPDGSAHPNPWTAPDGNFGAGVDPQAVLITAAGQSEGEVIHLGSQWVTVFADSISTFEFVGPYPRFEAP